MPLQSTSPPRMHQIAPVSTRLIRSLAMPIRRAVSLPQRFSISTASGIASRNAFSSPAISFRMTAANYDQRRLEFGRAMWAAPARAFRLECPSSLGSADAPYHMKASMAA